LTGGILKKGLILFKYSITKLFRLGLYHIYVPLLCVIAETFIPRRRRVNQRKQKAVKAGLIAISVAAIYAAKKLFCV
jgi:hypothetical protein